MDAQGYRTMGITAMTNSPLLAHLPGPSIEYLLRAASSELARYSSSGKDERYECRLQASSSELEEAEGEEEEAESDQEILTIAEALNSLRHSTPQASPALSLPSSLFSSPFVSPAPSQPSSAPSSPSTSPLPGRRRMYFLHSMPNLTALLGVAMKPKKKRRKRHEIERRYSCAQDGCARSYGTEGALKTHVKLKHKAETSS